MSNFLLLNFSMGPDGGDVVYHRGKKNLFVEDVLNYLHFTEEAESFLLSSSSSWSQLAAAVVGVVMAKNSAAAF
jgi:hypothetical protein